MSILNNKLSTDSMTLVVMTAADLEEFARKLISESRANLDDKLYSQTEFAELTGTSKTTLQKWRRLGRLTPTKIGRKLYYRLSDLKTEIK